MLRDESSFLLARDLNIEKMPTGHTCPCCQEGIEADDDAALLQVVQSELISNQLHCTPLVGKDGDYLYEPIFVHMKGCWSDLFDSLERYCEDDQPVKDGLEIAPCEVCGSSIRAWEVMVLAQYGEFGQSPRSPNNEPRGYVFKHFQDMDEPTTEVCLVCILKVVNSSLPPWEDLSENGECTYCTTKRCWRQETCDCDCHEGR